MPPEAVPHPPAPPGAESKNVSPLTEKTVGEQTLGFFSLISGSNPEELESALVLADCPDWEEKEDEAGGLQAVRRESSEGFRISGFVTFV